MRTLTTILLLTLSNVIIAQTPEWLTIGGGAPSAESSGSDKGIHIVADEDGNSYITGYYNVEADFGPFNTGFSFPSSKEVFIAKIDEQGAYQWVVNRLNYYDDHGLGICRIRQETFL